jgi:hypothetical protein
MSEREPHGFGERFVALRLAQEGLEKRGYYFHPVQKEHVEGLVTEPLVRRIRTQVKKRGFEKVAGHVAITFSGYADDPREVFAIPEVRRYWQKLDRDLPELPALLAFLPPLGFNGPGMHLMLMGTIDRVRHRPEIAGYDVHVRDAQRIIDDAIGRIHQAGSKYRINQTVTDGLIERFVASARHRIAPD